MEAAEVKNSYLFFLKLNTYSGPGVLPGTSCLSAHTPKMIFCLQLPVVSAGNGSYQSICFFLCSEREEMGGSRRTVILGE